LIGIKGAGIGPMRSELPDGLRSTAARWKRCVPGFAPINVLIAQWLYLSLLQNYLQSREARLYCACPDSAPDASSGRLLHQPKSQNLRGKI
jgi:hypothetical protein